MRAIVVVTLGLLLGACGGSDYYGSWSGVLSVANTAGQVNNGHLAIVVDSDGQFAGSGASASGTFTAAGSIDSEGVVNGAFSDSSITTAVAGRVSLTAEHMIGSLTASVGDAKVATVSIDLARAR